MGYFGGFWGSVLKEQILWVLGFTPGSPWPLFADDVIEKQIEDGLLKPELREKLSYVLLRKHRHQTKKPIHRSLADIGKSVSSNTGEAPGPGLVTPRGAGQGQLRRREEGTQGFETPVCSLLGRTQNSALVGFRVMRSWGQGGVWDRDGAV